MPIEALRWLLGQELADPGSHRASGHPGERGDFSSGRGVGHQRVEGNASPSAVAPRELLDTVTKPAEAVSIVSGTSASAQ
jgi:hypothetical protein